VVCAVIEEAKVLVNHGLLLPLNDLIAAEPEFAEDLYEPRSGKLICQG
jgi:hypothetical protein